MAPPTPGPRDTPPASPALIPEGDGDLDEASLGEDDAIEVIDLDEEFEPDSDEEEILQARSGGGAGGASTSSTAAAAANSSVDVEAATSSASSSEAMMLETAPEDNCERNFFEHQGKSVFCCDIHPKYPQTPLVASGGEDDRALVWDATTGQVVLTCDGFKDSVVQLGFSHDGSYLAAADMSGVVKVWKISCREVVWEFETSDITWLKWHHGANVLFATTVDSELWMWKIPSGESKIFPGHGEKAECAEVLPDGRRVLVGYGDGTMRLFDLKSGEVIHSMTGNAAHTSAVASLAAKDDNNLVASGGVDGVAKLFNTQSGKSLGTFACGGGGVRNDSSEATAGGQRDEEDETGQATVESMVFTKSAEQNFLVTGSLDGLVNVWDLSTQLSRQAFSVGSGVVKLCWRNGSANELLAATLDGLVRIIDVRIGKIVADCSGHTQSILDVSQSSDGNTIVTCSDDGNCKVYDVSKLMKK